MPTEKGWKDSSLSEWHGLGISFLRTLHIHATMSR